MGNVDPTSQHDAPVGQRFGLALPDRASVLLENAVPFLDAAFHAYGSIAADNAVVAVDRVERCEVGSTGDKLFLSVRYARHDDTSPRDLFVKFSRNFEDPFHDRRRHELESEIRLYQLVQSGTFPIATPRPMFGDIEPASGTGLLITERLAFGHAPIEPLREKCMDHELDDPGAHYGAIVEALANLAGRQRAGALGAQVEALFPIDIETALDEDPVSHDEDELRRLAQDFRSLVHDCPQLFPVHLRNPEVAGRLERAALAIAQHERAIKAFLNAQPDFIALTHFNANIDNAWFWRLPSGKLRCGLFDWQRARRMNVAYAVWGGLCAAPLDLWRHDLDARLEQFTRTYHAAGGPSIAPKDLRLHLHLYSALMGVAGLMGAPRLVRERLPRIAQASSALDSMILANEGARCFLHVFTVFLEFLEADGFAEVLPGILAALPSPR